jgi:2-hydroxychromene-2-carboxylate isomerase
MAVTVYGEFTCPFSYLASARFDRLLIRTADIEWRAVQRFPRAPRGREMRELATALPFEVAAVESWLGRDEVLDLQLPSFLPDTSLAVAALAALRGEAAHTFRRSVFEAYWVQSRNIGQRDVVQELAGRAIPKFGVHARRWRRAWEGLSDFELPVVILEDGTRLNDGHAVDALVDQSCFVTRPRHHAGHRATSSRPFYGPFFYGPA